MGQQSDDNKRQLEQNFLELTADGADIAMDFLTESELLKDLPVAGLIYKIGKAVNSVQDTIFLHKVGRFFKTVNDKTTREQRISFTEELKKEKAKRDLLYSAIFLKIDKFDDVTKSDLFAKIFACFITNKIRRIDFNALSSALNLATLEDLKVFSKSYWQNRHYYFKDVNSKLEGDYGSLLTANLVAIKLDQELIHMGDLQTSMDYKLEYRITELGCLYVYISEDFEDHFFLLNEEERNSPRNYFNQRKYGFHGSSSDMEIVRVSEHIPEERKEFVAKVRQRFPQEDRG
jgi:hypothetical protein